MKLFRFGDPGSEQPGVLLEDGSKIDVSGFGEDYNEAFFGSDGLSRLADWLVREGGNAPRVVDSVRLGSAVCRPSKILCIGKNYKEHAEETGSKPPSEPIVFSKASSALCGPNDPLVLPKGSEKTDWEVELALVIGKRARYVTEGEAGDHIAGYVLMNDYSERAYQLEHEGQWIKGKSSDSFAPLGPYLVTPDEIPNLDALRLWLRLNGESMQEGNTADLIFKIPMLVSYLSRFMSLLPGDVLSTGTPAGVGIGRKPQRFLKPGDVVELGIDGLGSSRQEVVEYNFS